MNGWMQRMRLRFLIGAVKGLEDMRAEYPKEVEHISDLMWEAKVVAAPERSGHWIRPTIDAGMDGIDLTVICYEPVGAECRQVIVRPAETDWRALTVTPAVTEDGGYCQWVDWLTSVGDEASFYEGPDGHLVAEGPISIRWESSRGDDDSGSFNWMYLDDTPR